MDETLQQRLSRLNPVQRARLEERLRTAQRSQPDVLVRRSQPDVAYPLSFAQQRIWFQEKWLPQSQLSNVPNPLRFSGPLDVEAFRRAVQMVVDRHEILRTVYVEHPDRPVQIVRQPRRVPFELQELAPASPAERDRMARSEVNRQSRQPFQMDADLMVRVSVLRFDPLDHLVTVTLHHIVADIGCVRALFREIQVAYNTIIAGGVPDLPEPRFQYLDYVLWEQGWIRSVDFERQREYWLSHLKGAPVLLTMPWDRPRPAVQKPEGRTVFFTLSAETTDRIRKSTTQGWSTFVIALSAYSLTLSQWSQQRDVVVGAAVANRSVPGTEDMPGYFLNTLALRIRLEPGMTRGSLLSHVRDVCFSAFLHQEFPFDRLLADVDPNPEASRTPLFQTMFVLQSPPEEGMEFSGLRWQTRETSARGPTSALDVDASVAKFDLQLGLFEDSEGLQLRGSLNYSTALFDQSTIVRLVDDFRHAADELTEPGAAPISLGRRASGLPPMETA